MNFLGLQRNETNQLHSKIRGNVLKYCTQGPLYCHCTHPQFPKYCLHLCLPELYIMCWLTDPRIPRCCSKRRQTCRVIVWPSRTRNAARGTCVWGHSTHSEAVKQYEISLQSSSFSRNKLHQHAQLLAHSSKCPANSTNNNQPPLSGQTNQAVKDAKRSVPWSTTTKQETVAHPSDHMIMISVKSTKQKRSLKIWFQTNRARVRPSITRPAWRYPCNKTVSKERETNLMN